MDHHPRAGRSSAARCSVVLHAAALFLHRKHPLTRPPPLSFVLTLQTPNRRAVNTSTVTVCLRRARRSSVGADVGRRTARRAVGCACWYSQRRQHRRWRDRGPDEGAVVVRYTRRLRPRSRVKDRSLLRLTVEFYLTGFAGNQCQPDKHRPDAFTRTHARTHTHTQRDERIGT